jgi:hypothetical protein
MVARVLVYTTPIIEELRMRDELRSHTPVRCLRAHAIYSTSSQS